MKELQYSDFERALSFGDALFETIYFKDGFLYAFFYHFKRLNQGAKVLNLSLPSEKKIISTIKKQINQLALSEARIKLIFFRSSKKSNGYKAGSNKAEICIFISPYKRVINEQNEKNSQNLRTLRVCNHRLGYNPQLSKIKHTNRLDQVIARNESNLDGVMLSIDGDVIETTSSNLIIYCNQEQRGQFITPNLEEYGVKGVIREMVIKAIDKTNHPLIEKNIKLNDFNKANQVLIMNSLIGIQTVKKIENYFIQKQDQPQIINQLIDEVDKLAIESGLKI